MTSRPAGPTGHQAIASPASGPAESGAVPLAAAAGREGTDFAVPQQASTAPDVVVAPGGGAWRDTSVPVAGRVSDLLGRMTLAEKLAQLGSVWLSGAADGDGVAPLQGE